MNYIAVRGKGDPNAEDGEYKETCGCGGCIETNGHPFHGECPVAVC